VCTEKSIQLETKGIQSGGVLPRNLSCVILSRSVEPGWRRTPAKFAPFSGESSFRYTQDLEQNSKAEILVELTRLVEGNVNCLALLGQFLDSKPVIAGLKVNDATTVRARHVVMYDEPGKKHRGCMIAMRAQYAKGNAVRRTKRHLDASQGVSLPD